MSLSIRVVAVGLLLVLVAGGCSTDTSDVAADEDGTTTGGTATTAALPSTSVAASTTAAMATTIDPGPLTIMPIGDFITSGSAGWPTYRCYLDEMLRDAGVSFDFVGGLSAPHRGGSYGCPTDFDPDHEGWWDAPINGLSADVTASVEALQPDVALVHLGTTDLFRNAGSSAAAEDLEGFVTGLQTVNPDITILVAQVIPCHQRTGGLASAGEDLYPSCAEDLPAFNDTIGSFAGLSTDESSVIVVDMETGFTKDLYRDEWTPNDAGDQVIAERWMRALKDAGLI